VGAVEIQEIWWRRYCGDETVVMRVPIVHFLAEK
jgi:hypothetical protein